MGRVDLDLGLTLDARIGSRWTADLRMKRKLIEPQKKPEYLYDLGVVRVSQTGHKQHYPERKCVT